MPDIRSQQEIFDLLSGQLPAGAQHASGGMPDVGKVSDVDVSLFHDDPESVLSLLPEGTAIESQGDSGIEYGVPGYERPVNVFATADPERAARAVDHRNTTIALAQQYPELLQQALALKEQGMSTEPAWAQVLGLEGDPYDALRDTAAALLAAQGIEKASAMDYSNLKDLLGLVGKMKALGTPHTQIMQRIGPTAQRALKNMHQAKVAPAAAAAAGAPAAALAGPAAAIQAPVAAAVRGAGRAGALGKKMSGPEFASMMEPYRQRIRYARG